jgi:hypothetical protein
MPTDPKPMTPAERAWWDRLSAVLAEQPRDTWLYVGAGSLHLMRCGPRRAHAHAVTASGGIDPDYVLASLTGRLDIDGGDW